MAIAFVAPLHGLEGLGEFGTGLRSLAHTGACLTLGLLNEVEERPLHHNLAIRVASDELFISIALVTSFDSLDSESKVSLLLLVVAVLVVGVTQVVDYGVPLLDQL